MVCSARKGICTLGASGAMSSTVESPSCHVCWRGELAVVGVIRLYTDGENSLGCKACRHILGNRFDVVL